MNTRGPGLFTLIGILAVVVLLGACSASEEDDLAFLTATEGAGNEGMPLGEERIAELRANIRELEDEVQEQQERYNRIASYHKLLAREYMNSEMYGPALDELQAAMEIQTENPVLYYLAGVSAARSARSVAISGREGERLSLAEQMYREALQLRPEYHEALYGIAVLLAFEMDRPEDALPFIQRLAGLETADPAVRFLLANILVRVGRTEDAVDVYTELARNAPSADQRQQAAENRDALLGDSNG